MAPKVPFSEAKLAWGRSCSGGAHSHGPHLPRLCNLWGTGQEAAGAHGDPSGSVAGLTTVTLHALVAAHAHLSKV